MVREYCSKPSAEFCRVIAETSKVSISTASVNVNVKISVFKSIVKFVSMGGILSGTNLATIKSDLSLALTSKFSAGSRIAPSSAEI